MSSTHESEGFVSTPLEGQGARRKDNYYLESEENEVRFREADNEYQRLKKDFARIARNRRARHHSRSDSSKSPSPRRRQPPRRSTNLPKFKIATFYATDVELWFNQIETQFDLHQIHDEYERYSLTCAALSGEVASDVRDVLLQPFRSHKYESLKSILIERRGLTTPERVNKLISGEKMGSDIPSRFLRRLQKTAGFGTQWSGRRLYARHLFGKCQLQFVLVWPHNQIVLHWRVWPCWPTGPLSKRLKKLVTATAAEEKRNSGRGRANNNYAPRPPLHSKCTGHRVSS